MIMQKAFPTDVWTEKRPLRYFNAINKTPIHPNGELHSISSVHLFYKMQTLQQF